MGVCVDFYCVTVGEFTGQKLGGQRVFQALLNRSLQRSCTEDGIITFVHNLRAGIIGEFEDYMAVFKTLGEVIELDIDNLPEVVFV